MYTKTNHVCDSITLNYTSMTHCVGIYYGTVAFYRDLTRITVSDIKSDGFDITLPAIILEKMSQD